MPRNTDVVKTVSAKTRAKVNLSLQIIRRRRDGYHEIETILQSVDLHDELRIDLTSDGGITITCSDPAIRTDDGNLCHRALMEMRRFAGRSLGARLHIQKNIPTGSGLGGGSANAAGVILAVDKALGLGTPMPDLEAVAADLGSDVPFMLHGGTMLGRGRGEKLTPLTPLKGGFFTIVHPNITISTSWAYKHFSFALTKHKPRINLKSVNAVLARFPRIVGPFRNDLEDVVCPAYPVVSGVLDELLSTTPSYASMTGSGSALYAVYESEAKAVEAAERFSVRGFYSSVARPAKRAIDVSVGVD